MARKTQLSTERVDSRVAAQPGKFGIRQIKARSSRVEHRETFEGLQGTGRVAQVSIDLGLALRKVSESRRDLFGLRASAVNRVNLFFEAYGTDRELVEPVECFRPI